MSGRRKRGPTSGSDAPDDGPIPAAMYVRMSTEHQQYSTENQGGIIEKYASQHGYRVVETFADAGKSGLSIEGRDALQRLIDTASGGQAPFRAILVYDVSRWGRFQDADESAYYEYMCKKAGVKVVYCAEPFENDGSPMSIMFKGLKRGGAAEYSRELSTKVFIGQCHLVELGFRQGGMAGYGLRRMLLDVQGTRKGTLRLGEQKSIQTDRIVLVPGPDDEVETVQWIYRAYVDEGRREGEIATILNARGVVTDLGHLWTCGTIRQVLSNEKYIGNNVFNRVSAKLKQPPIVNPPERWIRKDGAFQGIVDPAQFHRAQGIIQERARRFTNEELLERLRALRERHGRVSGILIDEDGGMPGAAAYQSRFGGLLRAYQLIGYTPDVDYSFIEVNRRLREKYPAIVAEVIGQLRGQGSRVEQDADTGLLLVNREILVSLVLSRCTTTPGGRHRWTIRVEHGHRPDITIAVRMDDASEGVHDYYVLPTIDMNFETLNTKHEKMWLAEDNGANVDVYRFPDLGVFYQIAERVALRVAA